MISVAQFASGSLHNDRVTIKSKVLFTMIDVNVGFSYKGHEDDAKYDEHKATLVWKPVDEKKRSRREESECAEFSLSFLFIVLVMMEQD